MTSLAQLRFETERLSIEPWDISNPELLRALPEILTPKVTAHLPPTWQFTGDAARWARARDGDGSIYIVTHLGSIAGLLTLNPDNDDIRLGYLLGEKFWGQGLATELITGLIATLPDTGVLIGGVTQSNPASAKVLIKSGFRETPTDMPEMREFQLVLGGQ